MEEGLLADVPGEKIPSLIPENEDLAHVLDVLCTTGYGAFGLLEEQFEIVYWVKCPKNMIFALLRPLNKLLNHLKTLFRPE